MTSRTGEALLDCAVGLGALASMWLVGTLALEALRALGAL